MAKAAPKPKKKAPTMSAEDQAKLDVMMAKFNKDYGKGAVQVLGNAPNLQRFSRQIPSGSIGLDIAIGPMYRRPDGVWQVGYAPGRITEVVGPESSGKTTLCLQVVANAQSQGIRCAFADMEHSVDPDYARALGVNLDALVFTQPANGEQCLDIVDVWVKSGLFGVIIVDSVAALITQAEIDGDMGDSQMGGQARLMSQAMRKLNVELSKPGQTPVNLFFTNQIREKIGVMFGCFQGETLVSFADGRRVEIRRVVKEKMRGPVLTYNSHTGKIEAAEITNWFNNGSLADGEPWIQFITTGPSTKNGKLGFVCTPNHILVRADGAEVRAADVVVGDALMSYCEHRVLLDPIHRDVICGSLLGDGKLMKQSQDSVSFSLANQEQPEYLAWKQAMLPMLNLRVAGNHQRPCIRSDYSCELKVLHDAFYPNGKGYRTIPNDLKLTPLMLAVWYMDDGHLKERDGGSRSSASICIKRLAPNPAQCQRAVQLLVELDARFAGNVSYCTSQRNLAFSVDGAEILAEIIHTYVPPAMQYKLPFEFRGKYIALVPGIATSEMRPHPAIVLEKREALAKKYRSTCKYDLEVAGHGYYLVGGSSGVVVHNSPETSPGGRALKFYASWRIDVRRGETLKDGENEYGHRMKLRVIKNKVAPPFRKAEFDIIWGKGIDYVLELVDLCAGRGIITVDGAWYKYKDKPIAQGRANAAEILRQDRAMAYTLYDQLMTTVMLERGYTPDASPIPGMHQEVASHSQVEQFAPMTDAELKAAMEKEDAEEKHVAGDDLPEPVEAGEPVIM